MLLMAISIIIPHATRIAAVPTRTPTRTATFTPTATVTATATPRPPFSFGRRSPYEVDGLGGIAVGDFNGDGRPDIAAIGLDVNANPIVTILYSQPDGTFRSQPISIPGLSGILDGIAAGKLLNTNPTDKLDDLALLVQDTVSGNDSIQVYANLSTPLTPSFQPRSAFPVGEAPNNPTVLDLMGDGSDNAIAVPNVIDGTVSLFFRLGSIFISLPTLPTGRDITSPGSLPMAVAAGKFNNDAFPDLAVALNADLGVAIHLNTGNANSPSFTAPPVVVDPNSDASPSNDNFPTGVVVADFNGDHYPDIALSNEGAPPPNTTGSVTVHLNTGDGSGTFHNAVVYAPIGSSTVDGLATGDFNGDGFVDIITQNGDDTLSILYGDGNGTFSLAPGLASIPVGAGIIAMIVADFNQDGYLDVATAEEVDGTVSVLLGGGVNPPPTLSPTPTITGTPTQTPTITLTPTITPTSPPTPTGVRTSTPTRPAFSPTPTVPAFSPTPTITPVAGLAGDADCNHAITSADVDAVTIRLFDGSFHLECDGADANRDQDITAADVTKIILLQP